MAAGKYSDGASALRRDGGLGARRGFQDKNKDAARTEMQAHALSARLAEREKALSQEIAARERLNQELALTHRNFEIADRALRVADQFNEIAARTAPHHSTSRARVMRPKRTLSALKRTRRGFLSSSFVKLERLRRELRHSPLFNASWYLSQRPDLTDHEDPLDHFLSHGMDEGTSPHPLIDAGWMAENSGRSRQSALRSYLLSDRFAEIRPTALFDVEYYRRTARLAARSDGLSHYLTSGYSLGLVPHPLFDPAFYRSQLPRVARNNVDPFLHYVLYPFELDPHPLFSNEYYLRQHPELRQLGICPLVHYLEYGSREKTSPHWSFSGAAYLAHHRDVAASGLNPLLHYAVFGKAEGRRIDPVS
jgi:hypothetical protein